MTRIFEYIRDQASLAIFANEILAPVVSGPDYLLPTLRVLVETDFNANAARAILGLANSSMQHRVSKLENAVGGFTALKKAELVIALAIYDALPQPRPTSKVGPGADAVAARRNDRIMAMIAEGASYSKVARQFSLSTNTVKYIATHRRKPSRELSRAQRDDLVQLYETVPCADSVGRRRMRGTPEAAQLIAALKAHRSNGMPVRELADALGVSGVSIYNWLDE